MRNITIYLPPAYAEDAAGNQLTGSVEVDCPEDVTAEELAAAVAGLIQVGVEDYNVPGGKLMQAMMAAASNARE